jgi:hypothetical protein
MSGEGARGNFEAEHKGGSEAASVGARRRRDAKGVNREVPPEKVERAGMHGAPDLLSEEGSEPQASDSHAGRTASSARGVGADSRQSRTTSSARMRWTHSSGLSVSLWASAGTATALTSSGVT